MYERTLSFLASACLHLIVFVLVLFWPAPQPPELSTGTMITGLVSFNPLEGTAGEPTKQDTPQPQKGREHPAEQPDKPADIEPQPVDTAAKPIEPAPQKDPEPVETAKKPDDTATPIPETPEKKTPPQNATAQKTPTETKNATQQKPPEQRKPDQKKPPEQKKPPAQNVDSALADLQQKTGQQRGSGKTTGSGSGQDLSSALADLGQQVGGSGGGTQGQGAGVQGGTGYGVAGAYEDSVVSRVKPNWAWPNRADRRNFVAVVNIKIAADGSIQSYTLKTSSGNPYFDSTVTNAIQATRILEPPPDSRFMDMDVNFSSEALSR